jgi:hypothetical protein
MCGFGFGRRPISIVSRRLIFVVHVVVGDNVVGRVRVDDIVYDIEPFSNYNHVSQLSARLNYTTQEHLLGGANKYWTSTKGIPTSKELGRPPTIFPTGTKNNSNLNSYFPGSSLPSPHSTLSSLHRTIPPPDPSSYSASHSLRFLPESFVDGKFRSTRPTRFTTRCVKFSAFSTVRHTDPLTVSVGEYTRWGSFSRM